MKRIELADEALNPLFPPVLPVLPSTARAAYPDDEVSEITLNGSAAVFVERIGVTEPVPSVRELIRRPMTRSSELPPRPCSSVG